MSLSLDPSIDPFIMHYRIWIVLKSLKIDFTSLLAPKKKPAPFLILYKRFQEY